jgi:hypothetical protein
MLDKRSGIEMKLMRISAGLKAIDVAIALGWYPSKLSLVENGRVKVSPETVVKIQETISRLSNTTKI